MENAWKCVKTFGNALKKCLKMFRNVMKMFGNVMEIFGNM